MTLAISQNWTKINIGCKAFYSMEDPKGTFRVPSIIGKMASFLFLYLIPICFLFCICQSKTMLVSLFKGSIFRTSKLFFNLFSFNYYYFGTNGQNPLQKGNLPRVLFLIKNLKLFWHKWTKSIAERTPFKIFNNIHSIHLISCLAFYPTHNMGLMH